MTQLVVVIIVVLIPEIIAAVLANKFTVHSNWDSFKYGLYAFVLGISTYALLQLFRYSENLVKFLCSGALTWSNLSIWNIAENSNSLISPSEIVSAVFLSVPVAFIAAACIQHKVITRIGNRIHVTTKYGGENLFSYFYEFEGGELGICA
jgi:hypothetical protein